MKKFVSVVAVLLMVLGFSGAAIANGSENGHNNGNGHNGNGNGDPTECIFCPSGTINFEFSNMTNSFGANMGFEVMSGYGFDGSIFKADMFANGTAAQTYTNLNVHIGFGECTDCVGGIGGYLQTNTGGISQFWELHSVGENGSFFNAGQSQNWNFGQYQGGLRY